MMNYPSVIVINVVVIILFVDVASGGKTKLRDKGWVLLSLPLSTTLPYLSYD